MKNKFVLGGTRQQHHGAWEKAIMAIQYESFSFSSKKDQFPTLRILSMYNVLYINPLCIEL